MQDANLNSGTPIFKIRILAQFVIMTFLNNPISHAKGYHFNGQTHIDLREIRCFWLKCRKLPHHPMQIIVNFESEGKRAPQSLPDKPYGVLLSHLLFDD